MEINLIHEPNSPSEQLAVGAYGSAESVYIPGTMILVSIFLMTLVRNYYANWKYLAEVRSL